MGARWNRFGEPPRRGGSGGCPRSVFWGKNKKTRHTPCVPQFYYIKVGYKGYITRTCYPDGWPRYVEGSFNDYEINIER